MLTLPIKKKWFEMIKSGEKKEEIERIINLFDKGYCNECNELNCLGGEPSSRKVAEAIRYLQSQLEKEQSIRKEAIEYIKNHNKLEQELGGIIRFNLVKLLSILERN